MAAVAMFSAVSFVAVLVSKVIPNVAGFLMNQSQFLPRGLSGIDG